MVGTGQCLQGSSTCQAVSCALLLPSEQLRPHKTAISPLSLLPSGSSDAQQSCLWQTWGGHPVWGTPLPPMGASSVPGTPSVDVGQELLMVSGRQRPAGAERAENTSPLLRGFSSQWGRGGCLPQPESPGNPAAQGLLAFSPAEQGRLAGIGSVRGTKTGRSGVRVRGDGCRG